MDLNISDELIQARNAQAAIYGGEYLHERTFQGVIFPESYGFLYDDIAFPYWTPTRDVLLDFEARLRTYLELFPNRFVDYPDIYAYFVPIIISRLTEFGRQYSGAVHEGRLALCVNFFLDWDEDWIRRPVSFDGHAPYIFDLLYDAVRKEIVRLVVYW